MRLFTNTGAAIQGKNFIDRPERNQPYANDAKNKLAELIFARQVKLSAWTWIGIVRPEDNAGVAPFRASAEAVFVQGAIIEADGGRMNRLYHPFKND